MELFGDFEPCIQSTHHVIIQIVGTIRDDELGQSVSANGIMLQKYENL